MCMYHIHMPHVIMMNQSTILGELQGTKWTLLPHAMPTLQCMLFHKDGVKSVPLAVSKNSLTQIWHIPYWSLGLSPKTIYTVGVSTIKTVKHKRFSGTITSAKKIVVEFMLPSV